MVVLRPAHISAATTSPTRKFRSTTWSSKPSFAGPTCFQRGDNNYYNQNGDYIAKQRSTSIRYRRDLAVEKGALDATDDPVWTAEDELKEL
jgi:hypothetical protein